MSQKRSLNTLRSCLFFVPCQKTFYSLSLIELISVFLDFIWCNNFIPTRYHSCRFGLTFRVAHFKVTSMRKRFCIWVWASIVFAACIASAANTFCADLTPQQKVLHLVNRLSFGPIPGEVERVTGMGIASYIDEQLAPDSLDESPELEFHLKSLKTTSLDAVELFRAYGPKKPKTGERIDTKGLMENRARAGMIMLEASLDKMWRALMSRRQLQEVMVDFWYNYFNVDASHGLTRLWAGAYLAEAIRPNALGNFEDILLAVVKHPAMLIYLENWKNTDPASPKAKEPFSGLDETFSTVLLSMFTLGDSPVFNKDDIENVARVFTGWTVGAQKSRQGNNGFAFDLDRHDHGEKIVLGKTLTTKGIEEGSEVLKMLVQHDATAHHVCLKLAQRFVSDSPPSGLIERMARVFSESKGDIAEVLRTMFTASEFYSPKAWQAKIKTPFHYVVSSIRATGVSVQDVSPLVGMTQLLNMPLFFAPDPDGYSTDRTDWITPRAVNARIHYCLDLCVMKLPLFSDTDAATAKNALMPDTLEKTYAGAFTQRTRKAAAITSTKEEAGAVLLASPAFMNY